MRRRRSRRCSRRRRRAIRWRWSPARCKPASKLLKLALAAPGALAFACYVPDARDAERLVARDGARRMGLIVRRDVARRIAEACGGNRAIIEQELDKFALYLDAAPERPQRRSTMTRSTRSAPRRRGRSQPAGRQRRRAATRPALEAELVRLRAEGVEGIPLIRAMLRRMALLARLRAEVERGNSVGAVMASPGKSLFWKEKDCDRGRSCGAGAPTLIAKAMTPAARGRAAGQGVGRRRRRSRPTRNCSRSAARRRGCASEPG